jgi:tRNA threonylcarbamoyladenosine biosynthesis protein TsaB
MGAVIGFDTATGDTAVAATLGPDVLFEVSTPPPEDGAPLHATRLLGDIERAAEAAGGWREVSRIAVGVGPGSFTGLRIGVATARALAQSLEIEVVGVGTLAVLARGVGEGEEATPHRLAVIDARRGEVFAALYDEAGRELWEPFLAAPSELAERVASLPEAPRAAGSGALRFRDELEGGGAEIPDDADGAHRVAARNVCALAATAEATGPDEVAPIYLRKPDAERWRERDSRDST